MNTLGLVKNSIYYSFKFPWAVFHPKVFMGYFPNTSQQMFFDGLLKSGFKRTRFQLIFKGQITGLDEDTKAQISQNFIENQKCC